MTIICFIIKITVIRLKKLSPRYSYKLPQRYTTIMCAMAYALLVFKRSVCVPDFTNFQNNQ